MKPIIVRSGLARLCTAACFRLVASEGLASKGFLRVKTEPAP